MCVDERVWTAVFVYHNIVCPVFRQVELPCIARVRFLIGEIQKDARSTNEGIQLLVERLPVIRPGFTLVSMRWITARLPDVVPASRHPYN